MKKWISLFFILALSSTLLPAVVSYDQQKVTLFSTVEEEQPDGCKEVKAKDETKALLSHEFCSPESFRIITLYPNLFILLRDNPFTGNHTPPPDSFC